MGRCLLGRGSRPKMILPGGQRASLMPKQYQTETSRFDVPSCGIVGAEQKTTYASILDVVLEQGESRKCCVWFGKLGARRSRRIEQLQTGRPGTRHGTYLVREVVHPCKKLSME
jgi:hypothetical protein